MCPHTKIIFLLFLRILMCILALETIKLKIHFPKGSKHTYRKWYWYRNFWEGGKIQEILVDWKTTMTVRGMIRILYSLSI